MPWPKLLVVPARLDADAIGISERDANLAAGGGLFLQKFIQMRVLLVQKHRRVDEDVDRALGATKQRRPEIRRHVCAVGVERDELGSACYPDPLAVDEIRPQVRFVLADQLHDLRSVAGTRGPPVDPTLRGLRIDARRLDDRVQVDMGQRPSQFGDARSPRLTSGTFRDATNLPGRPDTSRCAVEASRHCFTVQPDGCARGAPARSSTDRRDRRPNQRHRRSPGHRDAASTWPPLYFQRSTTRRGRRSQRCVRLASRTQHGIGYGRAAAGRRPQGVVDGASDRCALRRHSELRLRTRRRARLHPARYRSRARGCASTRRWCTSVGRRSGSFRNAGLGSGHEKELNVADASARQRRLRAPRLRPRAMSRDRHRLAGQGSDAAPRFRANRPTQGGRMEKRASGEIRVHERVDGRRTYSLRFRVNGKREMPDARDRHRRLDVSQGGPQARRRPRAGPSRCLGAARNAGGALRRDHVPRVRVTLVGGAEGRAAAEDPARLRVAAAQAPAAVLRGLRVSEIDVALVERYREDKVIERERIRAAAAAGAPLRDRRGQQRRPLSNESINKTLVTLTQILDSAVERGLLESNPAAGSGAGSRRQSRFGGSSRLTTSRSCWRSPAIWTGPLSVSDRSAADDRRDGKVRAARHGDVPAPMAGRRRPSRAPGDRRGKDRRGQPRRRSEPRRDGGADGVASRVTSGLSR